MVKWRKDHGGDNRQYIVSDQRPLSFSTFTLNEEFIRLCFDGFYIYHFVDFENFWWLACYVSHLLNSPAYPTTDERIIHFTDWKQVTSTFSLMEIFLHPLTTHSMGSFCSAADILHRLADSVIWIFRHLLNESEGTCKHGRFVDFAHPKLATDVLAIHSEK